MELISKLPKSGTTIFTVMSALAREHHAINLSQGFPDFECDPLLVELAQKQMRSGFNQYAPMQGAIQLRERIAEMIENIYKHAYSPDTEITVTAGATQAIYTAITAFVHAGEEVIVFEPAYDCYVPAIELQGAKAIRIQMHYPGFVIDWKEVKAAVNSKTRMIIINTPHNPSAATLKKEDLLELEKIVKDKNIIVLSDEVYEHMCFDNETHQSVARYPSLLKQSLLVSSFGKTIHATGWKIAYVAAPDELMKEFRKVHQFLVFAVNHPFQLALAEYLANEKTYTGLKYFYQQKRDLFLKNIKGSRFSVEPCSGTYFQLLKYDKISDEKDSDFAIRLTKEKKLAAVPLSPFYEKATDHKLLRFCFAKKDETLHKAAEILVKL